MRIYMYIITEVIADIIIHGYIQLDGMLCVYIYIYSTIHHTIYTNVPESEG